MLTRSYNEALIPVTPRCRQRRLRQLLLTLAFMRRHSLSPLCPLRPWRLFPIRPLTTAAPHQPLQIPGDLPGSEAPPIRLPAFNPCQPQPDRLAEIERLFRALPELPATMQPVEGAAPLSLAELQDMALQQSPLVRQAMADVQAARGAAIQAGAYPNPSVAFQEDNVNTGGTAGYQGVGISQTIPTGGKLALARRAANVDVQNAELTLRRTRNELVTQVRSNYYAVLVARERIKVIVPWRNSPSKCIEYRSDARRSARPPPTNLCNCGSWCSRHAPN